VHSEMSVTRLGLAVISQRALGVFFASGHFTSDAPFCAMLTEPLIRSFFVHGERTDNRHTFLIC
jgi:hypothetical protein